MYRPSMWASMHGKDKEPIKDECVYFGQIGKTDGDKLIFFGEIFSNPWVVFPSRCQNLGCFVATLLKHPRFDVAAGKNHQWCSNLYNSRALLAESFVLTR